MPYRMKLEREGRTIKREYPYLLITGDGKELISDLEKFDKLGILADKLVIGRSIQKVDPPIMHYVDVDADAGKWVCDNLKEQYPDKVNGQLIRHTLGGPDDAPWFDCMWDLIGNQLPSDEVLWHGSSALFAVLIGFEMGYEKIILAGVPMDSKGHWYFPSQTYGPRWTAESYQAWLELAGSRRADRVRSFSGYTKIMFDEPSRGWVRGYP